MRTETLFLKMFHTGTVTYRPPPARAALKTSLKTRSGQACVRCEKKRQRRGHGAGSLDSHQNGADPVPRCGHIRRNRAGFVPIHAYAYRDIFHRRVHSVQNAHVIPPAARDSFCSQKRGRMFPFFYFFQMLPRTQSALRKGGSRDLRPSGTTSAGES